MADADRVARLQSGPSAVGERRIRLASFQEGRHRGVAGVQFDPQGRDPSAAKFKNVAAQKSHDALARFLLEDRLPMRPQRLSVEPLVPQGQGRPPSIQ